MPDWNVRGILDATDDDLMTMMRTNVEGTVWAVRAAVAHFRRVPGAGGDIVIVASVAGLRGGADEAVLRATKFAQVGLARRLGSRGPPRRNTRDHDLPGRHPRRNPQSGPAAPKATHHWTTTSSPKTSRTRSPSCCSSRAGFGPPNGSCGVWGKAVEYRAHCLSIDATRRVRVTGCPRLVR